MNPPDNQSENRGAADPNVLLERRHIGAIEPLSPWRFHNVPDSVLTHRLIVPLIVSGMAVLSTVFAFAVRPKQAFALFFALVGSVIVLIEPFFGILAYYLLAFMRPQDVFWGFGDMRLTLLASVATLLATLVHFALRPNFDFLRKKQNLFLVVLWVFLFLSTQFGDFAAAESKWMSYYNKMFIIYFAALAVVTSEKKLYWLAWMIIIGVGYLSWWANEMYFFEGLRRVHGPGKPGAAFYDENDFAMVMAMAFPYFWFMMRHERRWILKLALLGVLPLAAHGVMVTFSRGGFLGMASVVAVIALRERSRTLGTALIAGGVVFFLVFAGAEYKSRMGSIDEYEDDRSAMGRIEAWQTGWKMATHNPLFGVGLKRYRVAFPYYTNFQPREAHNSWIQLAGECGLVAVACYGMLVVLTIQSLRRVRRRLPLLKGENRRLVTTLTGMYEGSLVGYLVCGFFLSMEDFEFFYLIVAMAQILDRVTEVRVAEAEGGPAAESPLPAVEASP
jgi:putative inorganic carbon (HCO3(-)) transporter